MVKPFKKLFLYTVRLLYKAALLYCVYCHMEMSNNNVIFVICIKRVFTDAYKDVLLLW